MWNDLSNFVSYCILSSERAETTSLSFAIFSQGLEHKIHSMNIWEMNQLQLHWAFITYKMLWDYLPYQFIGKI